MVRFSVVVFDGLKFQEKGKREYRKTTLKLHASHREESLRLPLLSVNCDSFQPVSMQPTTAVNNPM